MAKISGKEDDLTGVVKIKKILSPKQIAVAISLEKVAFANMKKVTNSALDYAGGELLK